MGHFQPQLTGVSADQHGPLDHGNHVFHQAQIIRIVLDIENDMPAIGEAVRAECTTGEIADALREVFGVYQER